ncbi:signal transduction protein [Tepiditoga spiralis]|uniref:Signal transduction protein n=1 Tax=Tepiditoga spiralis TaxID=2108365 RepID=A0A7G1GAT8_9BACT|nr:CBS domain-containing protein [Tepiditoga spiralis]BBE30659.1 signal transduction protein [Tepiditoga spiralis]
MYVNNWYSSRYKYVYFNNSIKTVIELMEKTKEVIIILREDNTIYNMINIDDYKFLIEKDEKTKLYEVYDPVEFFLYGDDMVEDAVHLMLENEIRVLPVVDTEMYPMGIFGFFEVLRAFKGILGMDEMGTKIMLILDDTPGKLEYILNVLSKENINILSLLTNKIDDKKRLITIKLNIKNVNLVSDILDDAKIDYETIFEEGLE